MIFKCHPFNALIIQLFFLLSMRIQYSIILIEIRTLIRFTDVLVGESALNYGLICKRVFTYRSRPIIVQFGFMRRLIRLEWLIFVVLALSFFG